MCHAAVEFEDAVACIRDLQDAGIRVTKLQISAGLRLPELTPDAVTALKQFDDPVYLHQVVEQGPGGMKRYADLPDALATATGKADGREWRVQPQSIKCRYVHAGPQPVSFQGNQVVVQIFAGFIH